MTNKLKTVALLTACAAILSTSCGQQSGNATGGDSDTSSLPTVMDSTYKTDTIKVEEKTISFPTTEAALDFMDKSANAARYQSGILPRMAGENLEYCEKLLNNKHNYFIVVDKAVMKVILYDKYGNMVKEYGCACARNYGTKHRRSDCRTPEGFFEAEGVYNSTDWLYTNDAGYTSPARGVYGPRFIRIKTPVTSTVGIHGTSSPGSIGRRVSHGCIRISNENILELAKYAEAGMPIIVSPGPHDMAVNKKEGYDVKAVTTGATKVEAAPLPEPKKKAADKSAKKETTPAENKEVKEEDQKAAPAEEKKTETTPAETPKEEKKASPSESQKEEKQKTAPSEPKKE